MIIKPKVAGNLILGHSDPSRGRLRSIQAIINGNDLDLKYDYTNPNSLGLVGSGFLYTRLMASINDSATTCILGSGYLTTGVAVIIDSEQWKILGRTTNDGEYRITRGYNSTTPASHSSGIPVYLVNAQDLYHVKLFHNGIYQSETDLEQIRMFNFRTGSTNQIDLFPTHAREDFVSSDLFSILVLGTRAELLIDPPANTDIVSMDIYWDQGNAGLDPDSFYLLDSIPPDRTWYETVELDSYTYRFWIQAVDWVGNISVKSNVKSITITAPPEGPTDLVLSLDPVSHLITLSWTASVDSGNPNFAGYRIYDNWTRSGLSLDDTPDLDHYRIFTAGISFTYPWPLFAPGYWIFDVRSVDKNGNESLDEVVGYLNLDSGWNVLDNPPGSLDDFVIQPLSGGRANIRWTYPNVLDHLDLDWSLDQISWTTITVAYDSSGSYNVTTGDLVTDTQATVYFRIRPVGSTGIPGNYTGIKDAFLDDIDPDAPVITDIEMVV